MARCSFSRATQWYEDRYLLWLESEPSSNSDWFLAFFGFPPNAKNPYVTLWKSKTSFLFFLFLLFVCFFFSFPGGARPQAGHWSSSQAGRGRRKIISCAPSPSQFKILSIIGTISTYSFNFWWNERETTEFSFQSDVQVHQQQVASYPGPVKKGTTENPFWRKKRAKRVFFWAWWIMT